jgi:putative sterol carrier protein
VGAEAGVEVVLEVDAPFVTIAGLFAVGAGAYEVRFVGGETISMQVRDGELVAMKLPAEEPDLVVEALPEELHRVISGEVSAHAAIAERRVKLHAGSETELAALAAMFAPFEDAAAAAA